MKKNVIASALLVAASLSATAQDDMYFVPTKSNVEKSAVDYGMPEKTYYSGSRRSVDDYNRMGPWRSTIEPIDSAGNDVVDFDAVVGVYPDSTATDYECTRHMSRFDDYDWRDPYWDGYYAGRASSWYMYDPWYSPYWYDSWYGWGWPYYGYYSSWYWYDPWYWGGWYGHYYHPVYFGRAGRVGGRIGRGFTSGDFRGARGGSSVANRYGSRSSFSGSRRTTGTSRTGSFSGSRRSTNGTFSGSRSTTYSAPRQSSSNSGSFGSSRSSGSFSGSRSGGFSGGSRGGGFSGGSRGGRR